MSSIIDIHKKLDAFLRKYYKNRLIRGLLLLLIISSGFYLILTLSEYWAYFSIVTRTILYFAYILVLVLILIFLVVKPIFALFRIGKLIPIDEVDKLLQKHFPELKDQLTNVLELDRLKTSEYSKDLIEAAIEQKARNIQPIPFANAVQFRQNLKYLKVFSLPVIVILSLYFFSPEVLSEGTQRIINYDTYFEKPSDFYFVLDNDSLAVRRGSDFKLTLHTEGKYVPSPIYIQYGGVAYLLQKEGDNQFVYEFSQVNQAFDFYLQAQDYQSKAYKIEVLPNPQILNFSITIASPKYTQLPDQKMNNNGDFMVPEGSQVRWDFNTKDIDKLWFDIADSSLTLETLKPNNYSLDLQLLKDIAYRIGVSNAIFKETEVLKFSAQIIPDEFPSIHVSTVVDSTQLNVFYFRGQASDDYGIKKVNFCYQMNAEETVKTIALPDISTDPLQEFYYAFDFKNVLGNGKGLSYFFEVWDNDGINGSKRSKSEQFQFYLPSQSELSELETEKNKSLQEKLNETQTLAKELQEDVKELKKNLVDKSLTSWEMNQELKSIAEKQNMLEQLMDEVAKENEKTNDLIKNLSNKDQELLEKQEQIEEMLNQLMDDEMKKLMEEINKLMKEFDKDKFNELSEKMEMSYEDLSEQLDRNLEELKRFEVEKKMLKTIDDLKELAEKHEELSKSTDSSDKSKETLEAEQAEHQKTLEEIKEQLKESLEKNNALEKPMPLDDMSPQMQEAQDQMQEGMESLQKGKNSKASKQQKSTSEQLQKMADQMSQMMSDAMQQQQGQDMASLKQIIENLNSFSFEQEDIMLSYRGIKYNDPRYIELFNFQTKNAANFDLIKDSLYALAKTQPMIAAPINKELLVIERELNATESFLDERKHSQAQKTQQTTMTSANNLTLLLSEILEQMQKQQSESQCQKSGNCKKPGGGKPKPGFGEPKQQAQSLKSQMQKMLDELKDGKGGKDGKKKTNGALGKMIAEQEKMQKMLSDLANSQGISPETAQKLKEIKKASEQIENELIQKNINPSLLKRQELILTRLLEAENSEFKREQDNKRESKTNINTKISNPKEIFKYKEKESINNDVLIKRQVKLHHFYKEKYKNYIINIYE